MNLILDTGYEPRAPPNLRSADTIGVQLRRSMDGLFLLHTGYWLLQHYAVQLDTVNHVRRSEYILLGTVRVGLGVWRPAARLRVVRWLQRFEPNIRGGGRRVDGSNLWEFVRFDG